MPLPLALEFPPTSDQRTLFVAAAVVLLGPLLVERIGLPGIVGVILGGLLVGPFVLGWVERDGIVESLGDLGILVLMFLAGLELDLDEFKANRRGALTFGTFTFSLPFVLGIGLAVGFGYGAATALPLRVAVGVPHARRVPDHPRARALTRPLDRHRRWWNRHDRHARVVGARGGRRLGRERLGPRRPLLEVVAGLAALALVCAFVLPWITRWFFAGVGQHRGARFLWILVALTGAAVVAEEAGIEGIVGAFFAGLALNRLVPARSRLMEQVEFIGGVLLIPFFLLSTGMLIDPEKFTEKRVLGIAALSLAVVVVGKAAAAVPLHEGAPPLAPAGTGHLRALPRAGCGDPGRGDHRRRHRVVRHRPAQRHARRRPRHRPRLEPDHARGRPQGRAAGGRGRAPRGEHLRAGRRRPTPPSSASRRDSRWRRAATFSSARSRQRRGSSTTRVPAHGKESWSRRPSGPRRPRSSGSTRPRPRPCRRSWPSTQ